MMEIEKITKFDEFQRLQPFWNELLHKSDHNLAFLSYEFIATEWVNIGWELEADRKLSPFLLVVREQDEIIAIFPLVKEKRKIYRFPITCIRPLGHVYLDRADMIIVRKSADVMKAVIDHLTADEPGWSLLMFKNVSESSGIMQYLSTYQSSMKIVVLPGLKSPYVEVNAPWDKYLKDHSRNARNSLKQKFNRLAREGKKVTATEYNTAAELESALDIVFEIDSKSWKAKEGTALSSTEKSRRYWRSLSQELSKEERVRIWILWINDQPAAFEYHVVYGHKVYSLKWSFDKEYRRYSPGLLLKQFSMKAFWGRSITEVDLLGSADSFKLMWTDMIRYHSNVYIFNNTNYSRLLYQIFGFRKSLQNIRAYLRHIRTYKNRSLVDERN